MARMPQPARGLSVSWADGCLLPFVPWLWLEARNLGLSEKESFPVARTGLLLLLLPLGLRQALGGSQAPGLRNGLAPMYPDLLAGKLGGTTAGASPSLPSSANQAPLLCLDCCHCLALSFPPSQWQNRSLSITRTPKVVFYSGK